MPKLKRISLKQRKFAQKYVETGNATESAMQAYDVKNRLSAKHTGSVALNNPMVQEEIEKALKRNGITFDTVLDRFKEIADWSPDKISSDTVLKATIEQAKLLKMYPDKIQKHESKSIRINLNDKNYQDLISLHKVKSQEIQEIVDSY